jgi:uncharacterized protein (DUF1499 family)
MALGDGGVRGRRVRVARAAAGLWLALVGCRSMQTYEPWLDPVSHLDVRLDPCPQSPNCVSSQTWNPDQRVAPIPFEGTAEQVLDRFAALIEATPGSRVVERRGIYLHAEYQSRILRFVDDLELLVDEERGQVHVRSASRRGWSDLGVNRRRVEALREAFARELVPLS